MFSQLDQMRCILVWVQCFIKRSLKTLHYRRKVDIMFVKNPHLAQQPKLLKLFIVVSHTTERNNLKVCN